MDWIRKHRPAPGTIFGLAALVIALGGVAFGAIPDSGGTIHGCYQKSNGNLRVVDGADACRASELAIDWSQRGHAGPGSSVHAFGPVIVPVGQTATLANSGPFTFTGRCSAGSGGLIIVSTTEEHSAFDATPGGTNVDFGPDTPESRRVMFTPRFVGEATFFTVAPDGTSLTGILATLYRSDNSVDPERCVLGGHIVVGGS